MPSDVGTFGISLGVSVITIAFTAKQAHTLTARLQEHCTAAEPQSQEHGAEQSGEKKDVEGSPRHIREKAIYESPELIRRWTTHALDVATNYPAALLTLIAYSQLTMVPSSLGWLFIVAAVVVTLLSFWLIDPDLAGP